jgi:guanylate kinase
MRVEKASSEILLAEHFDRVVINDDLEQARIDIVNIVRDFVEGP